jgi:hypothetical protein
MPCFPQLISGALVQYPLVKRRICKTISNTTIEGRVFKLPDPCNSSVEWDLTFEGLTSEERARLVAFYEEVEGRLGEFTFLDPTDNLLSWSSDPAKAVWTKEPHLVLTGGVADPKGGTEAVRVANPGAQAQSLLQTLKAPGSYLYCFSVWLRSVTPSRAILVRTTGVSETAESYGADFVWRRVTLSGRSETMAEDVTFGIRLHAGTAVEIFGMQVEAQPAPSDYRRTAARGGVYSSARLAEDVFTLTSYGPDEHSCKVRVSATLAG